jgi:hypothetical protein
MRAVVRSAWILALLAVGCAKANTSAPEDGGFDAPPDACVQTTEVCNDLDDDCDGVVDNGFSDKGMPCTVGTGACEATGAYVCDTDTTLKCDATEGTAGAEDCDGIDDDCDGKIDEDFDVGMPCDGADTDTCPDGVIACTSLTTAACNDTLAADPERCDTFDNDCDGNTDEGFDLGAPCDGTDSDACNEGVIVCNGTGGTICNDTSTSNVEVCNGADDDCRNGADDTFAINMPCTVGKGLCERNGQTICTPTGTDVMCSATAGMPAIETCGNDIDEDCTGADATCPGNDLPAGAIDISAGGTFTVDLSAAHDDNWTAGTDCGDQGGRDVFYQFTLAAPDIVYFDTFNADFDTVVRVFPGACTALGAVTACSNDTCATTKSQAALQLAAGTYCLVVDQASASVTAGASSLVFKKGGRAGLPLPSTSGSVTGTTTGGENRSVASCEANSNQPDVAYYFTTCPGTKTVNASLCNSTSTFTDTILSLRTGTANGVNVACSDDAPGCTAYRSKLPNTSESTAANATVSGPNLHWLIVDGYGTGTSGNGSYTLTYSIL